MKITKLISCIMILFLASCASFADAPFPLAKWGWGSYEKKSIDERYLIVSGIVVGTTTLDEVANIFGATETYKPDDKNYSPDLACYKSEHDDTSIIFQSGPLGGWSVVTAVWIGKVDLIDAKRCATSRLVEHARMTVNGLSLGIGVNDVQRVVGNPTFHNASFVAYRYQDTTTLDKGRIFDVTSGLEFGIKQNQVNWFRIYQQLSN